MSALPVPRGTQAGLTVVRPAAIFDEILLELVDAEDNVRVDVGELDELAASIHELGVIQPIKVTAQPDGRYRVVWGQRRVLACRQLGRLKIPAIVEPASDVDRHGARRSIEQLSENLQRKDLNPIEEAVALREVLEADPKLTQEALADKLGMSRPWVSNTLGLLEAAPKVQVMVREGALTASHVKALRGLAPSTQVELAKTAVSRGASAHGLEDMVQSHKRSEEWRKEREASEPKAAETRRASFAAAIEKKLAKLPRDVRIVVSGYGSGGNAVLVEELKKAGLTNVTESQRSVASRPKGGICDCVGMRAETTYNGVAITPGCFDAKHQRAKEVVEEEGRRAKYALQERVQAHVKTSAAGWGIPGARAIAIDRILAEAALFSLLNYRLPEWSVAHGGARTKPWDTIHALTDDDLGTELATAIAGDFRDHAGYHVDWVALAAELGVESPA